MAKQIFIVFGGKAKLFSTRRSYLKWKLTTREGWKSLQVPLFWLPLSRVVRVIISAQQFMRGQKPFENNCPVMVADAPDGIPVRCMFYLADGKTCPRHGDVSEAGKKK
jgi:hypothetical protein